MNIGTFWHFYSSVNMMNAFGHGVRVAEIFVFIVTSCDNPSACEPSPRGSNLSSIASHGKTAQKSTTTGGVGSGKQLPLNGCFVGNAPSVIESFGCSVSPARSAVGLISDVTGNIGTVGPVFDHIKGFWDIR